MSWLLLLLQLQIILSISMCNGIKNRLQKAVCNLNPLPKGAQ
jgi:hypothetical protein